jgi:hypothetical protein
MPIITDPGYAKPERLEIEDSGVAWPAIFGGTVTALAFVLLLAPLGVGLGMVAERAPDTANEAARAFTFVNAAWLIVTQWISSGMGGYLTGRLRTELKQAHTHEVFFRDTVNGFLTWALTTIVGVGLLTAGMMHHGYSPIEPMHGAGLYLFLSMWVGAFIASAAGALGGMATRITVRGSSMIKLLASMFGAGKLFQQPVKRKYVARRKAKFYYTPTPVTPHPKRGYSEFSVYGRRTGQQPKPSIGDNAHA